MTEKTKPYFSTSVEKGLRILNLFNKEHKKISLKDIAASTGLDKVTAFRYVNTLIELGYLKREPKTKLIKPGTSSLILSKNLMQSFDLLEIVKPIIDEAHHVHTVTIDVALLEGDALLSLYQRINKDALLYSKPIVESGLHCTALGKAVLAFLPEEEMVDLIGRLGLFEKTDKTITSEIRLLADLKKTKQRGYALNDEEYIQGIISLAAPLLNLEKKRPIGAVSFTFSTISLSRDDMETNYADVVVKLAEDISRVIPLE